MRFRTGSAMLALLVMIGVGGLFAARLAPNSTTIQKRVDESDLKHQLGALRMAIAMDRTASLSARFFDDWNDRTQFLAYLDDLEKRHLLARVPVDPGIPAYQWGTAPSQIFWLPTQNFLASASFEVQVLGQSPWATGSLNLIASISANHWPGQLHREYLIFRNGQLITERRLQSYQNENPLGTPLGTSGASLLIIQP